ncbi:MAG: ABC transporter permease [bacterium]|nr:ABC transporter permease [bacterium]
MGTYLVMKNNLTRIFSRANTYLIMMIVPIAIFLFGAITEQITSNELRIGVLGQESDRRDCEEIFLNDNRIKVLQAEFDTVHTDEITGRYDRIVDYTKGKKQAEQEIEKIKADSMEKDTTKQAGMNQEERKLSMLITIYMVIATIYASKEIKDEQEGVKTRFEYAGQRKISYFMGYVGSTFLTVMLQIGIALGSLYLFDRACTIPFVKLMGLGVLISFISSCFAVIIVRITRKELSANITASAIAALSSVLGGTFVAISQMPYILQIFSGLSPVRWIVCLLQIIS